MRRQLVHRHRSIELGSAPEHTSAGLMSGGVPDSSHPMWSEAEEAPEHAGAEQQGGSSKAAQRPHGNGGSKSGSRGADLSNAALSAGDTSPRTPTLAVSVGAGG